VKPTGARLLQANSTNSGQPAQSWEGTSKLFVYGTLLLDDVLGTLIDRIPHYQHATPGWRVVSLPGKASRDCESVVGDEAHIAADSPLGPRYGEGDPAKVDAYENRILLCKVDHQMVDDQWHQYTSERLLRIKAEHEPWVESRLKQEFEPEQN
jgi:hypothetical protein